MGIKDLQKKIVAFRDRRDWKQFHNPKDLALSLTLEAAEVLEHFQWKSEGEISSYLKKAKNRKALGEELSDVLYWVLTLSDRVEIDLDKAFLRKMRKNEKKYPVRKAKGSSKKYTEL